MSRDKKVVYVVHLTSQDFDGIYKDTIKTEVYTNHQTAFQSLIPSVEKVLYDCHHTAGLSHDELEDIQELEKMVERFVEAVGDNSFDYDQCYKLLDELNDYPYFNSAIYAEVVEKEIL